MCQQPTLSRPALVPALGPPSTASTEADKPRVPPFTLGLLVVCGMSLRAHRAPLHGRVAVDRTHPAFRRYICGYRHGSLHGTSPAERRLLIEAVLRSKHRYIVRLVRLVRLVRVVHVAGEDCIGWLRLTATRRVLWRRQSNCWRGRRPPPGDHLLASRPGGRAACSASVVPRSSIDRERTSRRPHPAARPECCVELPRILVERC